MLSYLLPVSYTTCPLLSVPTGELVAYLWRLHCAHFDFAEFDLKLLFKAVDAFEMAFQSFSERKGPIAIAKSTSKDCHFSKLGFFEKKTKRRKPENWKNCNKNVLTENRAAFGSEKI